MLTKKKPGELVMVTKKKPGEHVMLLTIAPFATTTNSQYLSKK